MLNALGRQLRQPSGNFGRIVSKMMQMRNREYYRKILNDLKVKNGDRIFEIGYGHGRGIHWLADNTENCFISGIDFSELMYREAYKRNKKFIDKGLVRLQFGDLLKTEMGDQKYDKIFCVNVIYFWTELSPVFRKIYSMLNNGGTFSIFMTSEKDLKKVTFMDDFCKYPIETVERELKTAGFSKTAYNFDNGYFIKALK